MFLNRILSSPSYTTSARLFSTSARLHANRAIVYSQNGQPADVLRALTIPSLAPAPPPQTANVRFVLSPINPADVNVIEGVYPSKPRPSSFPGVQGDVFVGGNEALAEVTAVGEKSVRGLKRGDWVVMKASQVGTWRSAANVREDQLLKVPRLEGLSEVNAATMMVNPATAYCLLSHFVSLEKGQWVLQNGANSAVGQAVIQLARNAGLKTINLVRNRDDIGVLRQELEDLGATHVVTYDELDDKKAIKAKVQEWTDGQDIRLGLNCVGGESTMAMAGLLGSDAHLVTYGAMAKRPVPIPASFHIFKNLTSHGFWLTRWYKNNSEQQIKLVEELAQIMASGKFKEPKHEVVTIEKEASEEQASSAISDVFQKIALGKFKKKVILKIEGADE
ncbi:trans-2-enoyl-CoA reductase [Russula brevipes]|nr:trans-2-enoyl-CoA reductase [Russula brevipes]